MTVTVPGSWWLAWSSWASWAYWSPSRLGRADEPDRVRRPLLLIGWGVTVSDVGGSGGVFDVAHVGHLPGDDPGDEIEGMVVDHRRPATSIGRPHVQPVLPMFVQAKAEQPQVLDHPREPLRMLQSAPDEDPVEGAEVWWLHSTPLDAWSDR